MSTGSTSAPTEAVHPDLAGGVAVVTGGGRGLGFSMAAALARQGMHVALLDVLSDVADAADRLADASGARTVGLSADVTDGASLATAFDAATDRLGEPSVLLNAAGVALWADSVDLPAADWRRVVDMGKLRGRCSLWEDRPGRCMPG